MAPRLSADAKFAIETCLLQADGTPNFVEIATAHNPSPPSVRYIYERMRQRSIKGSTFTPDIIGRPTKLTAEMEQGVGLLVTKAPYLYQDEIVEFIDDTYNIRVDRSTVSRILSRLKLIRKHLQPIPRERNERLRQNWRFQLRNYVTE